MTDFFRVKNFERFQHYKDRSPIWIKLYNELLDDYEFSRLPDASKAHLIAIWLLASRYENKIPYDAEWVARRINANSTVDLKVLADGGFIVTDQARSKTLAGREQTAIPEKRREREEKKDIRAVATATRSPDRFEEFWKAYPKRDGANPKKPARKKFDDAVKAGHDPGAIIAGAERYREYMRSKGQEGTQYVAQAVTWLNQARWEDELPAVNGSAPDDDYPRIKRMLDTEAERGEWPFTNYPKANIPPEIIARWQAERAAQ